MVNSTPASARDNNEPLAIPRRTLAAGAAWSVPAVTFAMAAPAFAASNPATPPGLQGWIWWTRRCRNGKSTFTLNMADAYYNNDYPNAGLWVYNTTPATLIEDATLTFSYSGTGAIAFDNDGSCTGWGAVQTSTVGGVPTYTLTYTGTWTHVPAVGTEPAYTIADCPPRFTGTVQANRCGGDVTLTITRTVRVNGETLTFTRSITL